MTFGEKLKAEKAAYNAEFKQRVDAFRLVCPHETVAHYYKPGGYPIRICKECGLQETGSWWSYGLPHLGSDGKIHEIWNTENFTPPVLQHREGRTIVLVNSQAAFYSLVL